MRVGVLGGSFDPIHNGHLCLSSYIIEKELCEEIIFLPCGDHNLNHKKTVSEKDRLTMLKLAIEEFSAFSICDLELNKKKPRTTFQSLNLLSAVYGSKELVFIMGMDNLRKLHSWYNNRNLVANFAFIIASRPNEKRVEYAELIEHFNENLTHKLLNSIIETHYCFSSSEVREKIRNLENLENYLPTKIIKYIEAKKLYSILN